jgi:photosystem II stability/assembly factor-like uncharacterized protein
VENARARRAVTIIAAALVTILVAAVIYLRPTLTVTEPLRGENPSPTPWTLDPAYQVAYDFVTPAAGWAALARVHANHVDYWIFATSDGTRHWKLQTSATTDAFEASVDLRFFDLKHGYVVIGRQVGLATADGGARWTRVRFPVSTDVELTFSDPKHGWFVGGDQSFDGNSGPFPLYSTADGGSTWTRLPLPPGGGFAFRNPAEGWAAVPTEAGTKVFSTNDGGLTWMAHPLPQGGPPNGNGKGGLFGASLVRLLPGHGVMATAGLLAFTSMDGGATWEPVLAPAGATFGDIAFQDATHWWAMPSGNLFKTSDAGQTWTHVALQFDDWQYRVEVIDARHAWARLDQSTGSQDPLRGTAFALTADGGVHWSYANVPRPPS